MGLPKPILTEDEYLKFERAAPERHIFLDGEIFAMAGESVSHGDISVNLVQTLANQLDDTPCRVRIANTRVRSGPLPKSSKRQAGLYSYPDVFVLCGEPKFLDDYQDVILNPKVSSKYSPIPRRLSIAARIFPVLTNTIRRSPTTSS